MSQLIYSAQVYAVNHHRAIKHMRKYSGLKYESHLITVVKILTQFTQDEETLAAAWCHDLLEDTPVTRVMVEYQLGYDVAELVEGVSDISTGMDLPRRERKALDHLHYVDGDCRVHDIKVADALNNCKGIATHDPKFAKVYLLEKLRLVHGLTKGHPDLRDWALCVIWDEIFRLPPNIREKMEPEFLPFL